MPDETPSNPYQLGDPATAVGRVRPFPASLLRNLVSSLISKATGPLTVLVVVGSEAHAMLVQAMQTKFNVHPIKQGGHIAESVGRQHPCQVVIVDSPDHPTLAAAAGRDAPKGTGTVIVANQPFPSTSALAQLEQQRSAVRYQLDPAL